jgi:hypothetical protein
MLAVFYARPNFEDPLASIVGSECPEPEVPDGWALPPKPAEPDRHIGVLHVVS